MHDKHKSLFKCSFCGQYEKHDLILVKGPGVYICENCIEVCTSIVGKNSKKATSTVVKPSERTKKIPKPTEIKKFLDEHIIGQEKAKRALSVAVYNHYKRINNHNTDDIKIQKSNILLAGPTGSGKTFLAETLANILEVPFATSDATSLTESGYVGDDVENILFRLLQACDFDVEKAQKGIIYIDEIDKLSRKSGGPSLTKDVSGEGVQQALLKIIEGTVATVPVKVGRKTPNQDMVQIDTSNILFIVGGAFEGIQEIIKERTNVKEIGFGSGTKDKTLENNYHHMITPEDLVQYGIIPELIGRLPILSALEHLDEKAMISILTKPKNAIIKQFKRLYEFDNQELDFTEDALSAIAQEAITKNTGARGLRSVLENTLLDLSFEMPVRNDVKKIIITKEFISSRNEEDLLFEKEEMKEKIAD